MADKLAIAGRQDELGIKHCFGEEMISKGVKFNQNINEGCSREEPARTKATTPFRKEPV
jgi:hypothetical protein